MSHGYTEYYASLERLWDSSCFRTILHFVGVDDEHRQTALHQVEKWFELNVAEEFVMFNDEGNSFIIECWCDAESALKIWRRWYPGMPFMPYNSDVTDPRR